MELIKQVVSTEREIEIPERGPGGVSRCTGRRPLYPRASAREGARYAGAHLLQVRGRQPVGQPQAQHRPPAGLLQQAGRREAPRDGDRRRPMGRCARVRRAPCSASTSRSSWWGQLRPEAVPADPDGDLRREGRRRARARHRVRSEACSPRPRPPGLARHRHQRGGRGRGLARRAPSTRSAPCSTSCCCTRRSSARRRSSRWGWLARSRTSIIGCAGGGSNFAGLTFPFLGRKLRGEPQVPRHRRRARGRPEPDPGRLRATTSATAAQMTPLVKMHTLGHDFVPEPIHAGGLRYHGMAPLVSLLKEHGRSRRGPSIRRATFEAGVHVRRAEGILPAPEPTHAIRVAVDEALARARRRANRRSSCSTCAVTVTSIWRRTSATRPVRSRTTSIRAEKVEDRARGSACRRLTRKGLIDAPYAPSRLLVMPDARSIPSRR